MNDCLIQLLVRNLNALINEIKSVIGIGHFLDFRILVVIYKFSDDGKKNQQMKKKCSRRVALPISVYIMRHKNCGGSSRGLSFEYS